MEESHNILYEALSPLRGSQASDDPTLRQSPPPDELDHYTVFRNEISLTDLHCAAEESPAQDFFSLDVNESGVDDVEEVEPKTPPAKSAEPRMENRWFKGNSRFKSPMLQLHKGDKFDLNCEINSLICEFLQQGLLALCVFV